ncbi:MAG: type IV pili twitching motility protein PilT [Planctomycetes bacterium GWF2_41_51]|nr:MAG: type IV pili twitching motility protein PilT [Planctomycetes bacterium GWF2_41_51]HBG25800.1 type IV pili twitching motility protein PilT [Phycisphaerales bacterium]
MSNAAIIENVKEQTGIKQLLAEAVKAGASDLHINAGMAPVLRINTELVLMKHEPVTPQQASNMVVDMVGAERFKIFESKRDYDFSTYIDSGHRFRVNAHYQKETAAISFRLIPNQIPDIDKINLPKCIAELTKLPRGLVLVTGHTGSGKSTTLAAMIGLINRTTSKRIITLEDPVEYAFENDKSMIEQREIGSDCPNFESGLKHALRQDPEVILVGEMRDLETTSATITAAETGHLVFSTLHTINASQTIERAIDIYPAGQQNQIRAMLSNTLQAVISQTLFKRIDKPGMVPGIEIMLCNPAIRNCIRENRIHEIPNIITTSRKLGMQEMDMSIAELFFNGMIDREDALSSSTNPQRMEKTLVPENRDNFLKFLQG